MTLVEKLNRYWENHEANVDPYDGSGKWFDPDEDEEGSDLINDLFEKLFIGSNWNYETKNELQKAGYRCWVGDGDSFGILVACISKNGKNLSIG